MGPGRIGAARECQTCRERGRLGVRSEQEVAGTAMCGLCWSGKPGSEVSLEQVQRPARMPRGGRLPEGWPGGLRVVQATGLLAAGAALRFVVPPGVPVNRARWGIYRAARLSGVGISIVKHGSELTVWRNGSREQSK